MTSEQGPGEEQHLEGRRTFTAMPTIMTDLHNTHRAAGSTAGARPQLPHLLSSNQRTMASRSYVAGTEMVLLIRSAGRRMMSCHDAQQSTTKPAEHHGHTAA